MTTQQPEPLQLRVDRAAIRFRGIIYSVDAPGRHHDCIRLAAEQTGEKHIDCHDDDQGFILSDGDYVGRRRALTVATQAGQLLPRAIGPKLGKLFSEDVW